MSVLKRSVPYKSEVSIITFATPRTAIATLLAVKNVSQHYIMFKSCVDITYSHTLKLAW